MRPTARQRALYARLEQLRERDGGRLTADAVWQDAKADAESPTHAEFTWDLERAAVAHWRDRARALIEECYVQVRFNTTTHQVPAYVRDVTATAREQGYVSVATLKTDRDLSLETLEQEVRRARGALERARRVAVALQFPTATVDDMLAELDSFAQHVNEAA